MLGHLVERISVAMIWGCTCTMCVCVCVCVYVQPYGVCISWPDIAMCVCMLYILPYEVLGLY